MRSDGRCAEYSLVAFDLLHLAIDKLDVIAICPCVHREIKSAGILDNAYIADIIEGYSHETIPRIIPSLMEVSVLPFVSIATSELEIREISPVPALYKLRS